MLLMSSLLVILASSRWMGIPVGMSEMELTTCQKKSTVVPSEAELTKREERVTAFFAS